MPLPQEHSCRLRDPSDFKKDSFRRVKREHEGKEYSVIMGRLKDEDTMTEQAYRYDKDIWSTSEAKSHCKEHKGTFEAAEGESSLKGKAIRECCDIERRYILPVEIRMEKNDKGEPLIMGYPAVFNKLSEDLMGFKEKIAPGTFKKSIKSSDIRALLNHDENYILGRNTSGTLKLKEDNKGLYMEVIPPRTTWANDLIISMERGDINQGSFGFRTVLDEWDTRDEENPVRILKEAELFDVSIVTFPAYTDTSIALRSLERFRNGSNNLSSCDDNQKIDFNKLKEIYENIISSKDVSDENRQMFIEKLEKILDVIKQLSGKRTLTDDKNIDGQTLDINSDDNHQTMNVDDSDIKDVTQKLVHDADALIMK